jgi:undecaprenyl-phosphate 4-deoxy-4-formamido-L-arabinose transferase
MPAPLSISAVIPVYNSASILPALLDRLGVVLRAQTDRFEAVLVNDGSRDESWSVVRRLAAEHPWVRGINLMRNYGQHNALLCGVRACRHDLIVTLDDDLQHPPEEIPKLLNKLQEGYDVVYGVPAREEHGLWRDLASQATKLALQSAMGAEIARNVSAYRVFRAQVRDAFAGFRGSFVSLDVLLTWGTTRFAGIPVQENPRMSGRSNYTFRKLVTHALNMVTGFSVLPLQVASLFGFAFALFGFLVLVFVIGQYLLGGGRVAGFPFLASIIAIFSGVQLFSIGIIGEYLARMHFRIQDRPSYAVREETRPNAG